MSSSNQQGSQPQSDDGATAAAIDNDNSSSSGSGSNTSAKEDDETMTQLLSQLIATLSVGARAVQGLPTDSDEFSYQSTFPEFSSALQESHQELLDTLLLALQDDASLSATTELDDPLLWETCADACDGLVEQVEGHLRKNTNVKDLAQVVRQKAHSSFGKLVSGIVDMPKPQVVYKLYDNRTDNRTGNTIDASARASTTVQRTAPFVPPIRQKFHAIAPLDLTLQPGNGLDTRFGELRKKKKKNAKDDQPKTAAQLQHQKLSDEHLPSHHVPHVYATEIRELKYTAWQLEASPTKPTKMQAEVDALQAKWIDTAPALQTLVDAILDQDIREVAIDLEAHSFRSFPGFVCLMQLSYKNDDGNDNKDTAMHNHLIDPFPIWNEMGNILGPMLANPNIVKIFHGADSDVQWLQRDFGLYVVNLFDTGRAARALKFPSAGYAYLLQHYVGITPDKAHQLSDWRQRPLPDDMKQYAIMDTHYLIDVYHRLKYDLDSNADTSIREVLDVSKQVSLIRYTTEPFRPERYKTLLKSHSRLNRQQELVLRALFDWRDQTARDCDESLWYVCRNDALLRMAMTCPTSLSTLQGLFHPMPPLVLQHAKDIVSIIQRTVTAAKTGTDPPATKSAFTKPTKLQTMLFQQSAASSQTSGAAPALGSGLSTVHAERTLLSPVLGTEALYKQAGWITPDFQVVEPPTTTTEEEGDGGNNSNSGKPRRVLAVHPSNKDYQSRHGSAHSLQLGIPSNREDGSAATVIRHDDANTEIAQHAANQIRMTISNDAEMMGLIVNAPIDDDDDGQQSKTASTINASATDSPRQSTANAHGSNTNDDDEQEFVIPRSMREIYKISNRNRKNKKTSERSSGGGADAATASPSSQKQKAALAKAEEVLNARGLDGQTYFDDSAHSSTGGSPKRQRTKSVTSQSSEEAAAATDSANQSREEDVMLMQEVGWITDKSQIDNMMVKQQRSNSDGNDIDADKSKPNFDYSGTGQIGVFPGASSNASSNPFFAGASTTGGYLAQQFGGSKSSSSKKKQSSNSSSNNNSGGGSKKHNRRQTERPEKQDGKSQAFRKR